MSSFFRKGKTTCYKVLESKSKFQRAFGQLGSDWDLPASTAKDLEHFLCAAYGCKAKEVNLARYEMFDKKYTKENKVIDMALLIPCQTVFMLHVARSNYYAAMLKRSLSLDMNEPLPTSYGWSNGGSPVWIEESFPRDIEELFFDPNFDQNDVHNGDECDSDEEED